MTVEFYAIIMFAKEKLENTEDIMCTAITFKTKDHYFGRNLDYEYSYDETVTVTPQNYPFDFRSAGTVKSHYAILFTTTPQTKKDSASRDSISPATPFILKKTTPKPTSLLSNLFLLFCQFAKMRTKPKPH